MTKLKVLGNILSLAIAPGTRRGMYLRNISGVSFHSAKQKIIQEKLVRIAMASRGKSRGELRQAVTAGMSEGEAMRTQKAEARKRARWAATDAKWARVPAMAATPGLY